MKTCIIVAFLAIAIVAAVEEPIKILRQDANINPDGSYESVYETENGIKSEERRVLKGDSAEITGSFEYSGPDGTKYAVTYVANENGYQPQGDHLPVPPEIPAYIQRALEWIAAHPQKEEKQGKKQ